MILLAALALQTGWKTVVPTGQRFQVKMPAAPQESESSFEEGGLKLTAKVYMAVSKEAVYQIVAMRLNQSFSPAQLKELYSGFDKNYLANIPAKATARGTGKLGIYPGRWVSFTARGYSGIYWAILSKGDLYVLSAIAVKGDLAAVKKPFFDSFKLR